MRNRLLKLLPIDIVIAIFFASALLVSASSIAPRKLLVVLVQFKDTSITYSDSDWHSKVFGLSGNTVNKYYNEISKNQFYFIPASESYGTSNDGIIKVTLDYNLPTDPIDQMANVTSDAIKSCDPFINFASYDTNNDGRISGDELEIAFIYAGYDASYSSNTRKVFPISTCLLSNEEVTLDSKKLMGDYQKYSINGEKTDSNSMVCLGAIVHELGHVLGMPDLYAGDLHGTVSSYGPGIYSLMATGCWGTDINNIRAECPTHLDPYYKIFYGFCDPTTVTTPGTYTLYNSTSPQYNILKIPTTDPNQYFLIENRQLTGYDYGLSLYCKNGGILVWHIDKSKYDNNVVTDKMTDIEEANEGDLGYSQLDNMSTGQYDHFYYAGGHTVFSGSTVPNSNLKNGTSTGFKLEVLSAPGTAMQVKIDYYSTPQNLKAAVTGNTVSLSWDTVPNAPYYEVNIDGVTTKVTTNSYTYTMLNTNNAKHNFKVRVSNGVCSSSWSKVITTNHIKIGDINGDNSIDSSDHSMISRFLINQITFTPQQAVAADVDNNGIINETDKTLLNDYINRNITSFPAGTVSIAVYGDVDSDGKITDLDKTAVNNYILNKITLTLRQKLAADVDGDYKISSADSSSIERYVNNQIMAFSVAY